MRIGALLLVGLGILSAAACTASTSADLVCNSGGGQCVALPDGNLPSSCGQVNGLLCDPGYICCLVTPDQTGNAVDGAAPAPVEDSGSTATGG